MNKINTQLPRVELPEPQKVKWFSTYHLWGYAFLGLTFLLIVGFIYQMEYRNTPIESRICIQVVTTARSPYSGETKDFPTPCDVPEGWEVVPGVYNEIPGLDVGEPSDSGSRLINPNNPNHVSYKFTDECTVQKCTLIENRGGKAGNFLSISGEVGSLSEVSTEDTEFELIGWNDNIVVVQVAEPYECARKLTLHQIQISNKMISVIDDTIPDCSTPYYSDDGLKYEDVKEELRKTLVDPRLI